MASGNILIKKYYLITISFMEHLIRIRWSGYTCLLALFSF